jgi:hypothetical protein
MMFVYKIADFVFGVDIKYKHTYSVMEDFLAPDGAEPEFTFKITEEDLDKERSLTPYQLPDYAYESTAVYRKYIYVVLEKYDAFFFHCSAISVDNQAVMFTARSGTGKSTHRNLWLKNFGDRVVVINDDKPIIRRIDGKFYVYGTPWNGKENFGSNVKVPAKALCFLSRSKENSIGPIDTVSIVSKALNQTVRPKDAKLMSNLLELLDGFIQQVDTYDLRVNMEDEAALTAYNKIFGEK